MSGAVFLGLGALCIAYGWRAGGTGVLMVWLGVSFCVVGVAYLARSPRLMGKRADGRFSALGLLVHWPFLGASWLAWQLRRRRHPTAWNEVADGVFLGRMATLAELPPGEVRVVDLTCELWPPRKVLGPRYTCLPTLDGTAPEAAAFWALAEELARDTSPVFIHCAAGRGRSATLAAALLLARNLATDVGAAEALLQARRPQVRLSTMQRALLAQRCAS